MKNLKLLIILLIILAIGLTIVLVILNLNNDKTIEQNRAITYLNNVENNQTSTVENQVDAEAPQMTFNTSLQKITSNSMLYSISKNINKYFNYIREGNMQAVSELGGDNLYTIPNYAKYVVKQAYSTGNAYMTKYYTYGILTVANGNYTSTEQEICMIIYLTAENKGYKIETITPEEFNNMKELEQDEKINIVQGTYNIYEYEYVDNVKQMEIYLEDFVFQTFFNTENAYNLLNEEYKLKRFGNINEFVKYVTEKQNQLKNIKIVQYNVDDNGENKIYKGTDEYGNYYHIIEKSYMEYEIILDNYTMQDYSGSSQKKKIEKSAEKFILMLNSADYTNAYNLLEPTFKATYFPTEQEFINYIKSNWFARNIIASREANEDGTCVVTIKETISTTSNKMQKQFKVNMGEGMDFTIEFNV